METFCVIVEVFGLSLMLLGPFLLFIGCYIAGRIDRFTFIHARDRLIYLWQWLHGDEFWNYTSKEFEEAFKSGKLMKGKK